VGACHHENPVGANFCATCGAPLASRCISCGAVLVPDASFCTSCGVRVPSEAGEPRTSRHLGAGAVSPSEGERRRLTIMFCDLADSTAMSLRLDPETFSEIVDTYYHLCGSAIRRCNGFVANYIGDGLLALFGYPEAGERTSVHAVTAALEIQRAIADLNRVGGAHGVLLSSRVGLHHGLVVVTEVGTPERRETHVLGDAVNVTARVQTFAGADSVVITEELKARIGDSFVLHPLGAQPLKGVSERVRLYRVDDRAEIASHVAGRAGSPFVDRVSELALLGNEWNVARAGEGRAVLVLGEPGIGKSALVQQLRDVVEAGGLWIEGAASRLEQMQPFAAVRNLVESQFGWPSGSPGETRLADVEASLLQVDEDPSEGLELVCDLLEIPVPAGGAPLLVSPEERRRRLMSWMVRWLRALSVAQPVALVVEDLQWADPSSLETLTKTLEQIGSSQCLLVMTARVGFVPPWGSALHHTQISLNRLGHDDTRAIVQQRLGANRAPEEVVEAVVERSDGVPLFAEELAGTLGERVVDSLSTEVPGSLYDSVMARLDRLGPTKAVAQMASVIGREFSFDLLLEISGVGSTELSAAFVQLVEGSLVLARGTDPSSTYRFKHALVQQAAYDSMLRRRCAEVHRSIAEALTRRATAGEPTAAELLAHHWSEAGEAREAILAWENAARRALSQSAYAEAGAHYERAIALLDELEEEPERVERELALQLGLTEALQMSLGLGAPEVNIAAERARKLSEYLGDPQIRLRTLYNMWGVAMSSGEIMSGQALADELLALADDLGDDLSWCKAHIAQSGSLYNRCRLAEAMIHASAVLDRPREALATILPVSDVLQASLYGGAAAAALGNVSRAKRCLGLIEWARHLEEGGALRDILGPLSAAVISVWLRDFEAVKTLSSELEETGTRFGIDLLVGWGEIYGGWADALTGDAVAGVSRTSGGLAKHVAAFQRLGLNHSLGLLAEAQLNAGMLEEAASTVADALQLRDGEVQIQHMCELYRIRAGLHLAHGELDEAQGDLTKAIAIAARADAALLELRAATVMARSFLRSSRLEEARDLLVPICDRFDGLETEASVALARADCFDRRQAGVVLAELGAEPRPTRRTPSSAEAVAEEITDEGRGP
jgi:class 3 adenylate cyclase